MACYIFGAGSYFGLIRRPAPEDTVIAADGGWRICREEGIVPDLLLGDFDSLHTVPDFGHIRRVPVEKDDTDSMLAVRLGLKEGCTEFLLYGSLDGPRLDHTVANFQTLQYLADRGATGYLVGNTTLVTVVKNGKITFPAGKTGTISVFCMGSDATGVTERGLYYKLENGTLTSGFPLGVSNHFTGEKAEIEVKDGSLLVLWERKCGFPTRN